MVSPDSNVVSVANGGTKSVGRRPHVLMIPLPEQGHYIVFHQLIYFLSSFDLTVTVCSSEQRVKQLEELLSAGEFKSLDLRLVSLSNDVSKTADLPGGMHPLWGIVNKVKVQFQPYLKKLAAETNPDNKPTCLIADILLNWSEEVAEELQIPRYLLTLAPGWSIYTVLKENLEGSQQTGDDLVNIPGQFSIPLKETPTIIYPMVNLRNLAGVLMNTVEEFEGEELMREIRTDLQRMNTKPGSKVAQYLPVGPLLNIPSYSESRMYSGLESKSKGLEWLDSQPASSVVYVAFGSQVKMFDSLIFELARGLESSGVPFLWALRLPHPSIDVSTLLPPGFLDRVKTRGFVETGWAPQLQILQHPSTGGFLSHCGWNSSLESISAGVPLLTWPMHGDQFANASLVVEWLKVGLPVRKPGSSSVVPGEDVAAAVRTLMIDDKGKELRKNTERLKGLASSSIKEGGSSHTNLQRFIKEIHKH